MAGSLTDTWEKKLLDYIFRDVALGLHASNLWLGLFTVAPTDSTAGTEVTGGAYARVAIARSGTPGWAAATGTTATTAPTATQTFATATANWGTVTAFGIFNSLAGAPATDMIFWGDLSTAKAINNGDTASFTPANLTVTCD